MSNLLSKLISTGTIKANLLSDDNDILNCRDITLFTDMIDDDHEELKRKQVYEKFIGGHSRKGCI